MEEWDSIFTNRRTWARKELEVIPNQNLLMSHMEKMCSTYGLDRSAFRIACFCRDSAIVTPEWVKSHNEELEYSRSAGEISDKEFKILHIKPEVVYEDWIWRAVESTHDGALCRTIMGYQLRPDRFEELFPRMG